MGTVRAFAEFVADDRDHLRSEYVLAKYPTGILSIYVRRCIRWRGAFEIGNVKLTSERRSGNGTFTAFLEEWNHLPLLVENVHNPRLAAYLERNGWLHLDKNGWNIHCNAVLQELMEA